MDPPVFSQIPSVVYNTMKSKNKLLPSTTKRIKHIKFSDDCEDDSAATLNQDGAPQDIKPGQDPDIVEPVSKKNDIPLKSVLKTRNEEVVVSDPKPDSTTLKKDTLDAIVQTESDQVKFVNKEVQTDESYLQLENHFDQYRSKLHADSIVAFKPMYSLRGSQNPPLKMGLTLPKGVKRKVFYPDDED